MLIKKDLINLGLSESQAHLYAWLLEHGQGNIMQIARGIGYSRKTVYNVIEQLKKKGLVIENQGKRITYSAQSPTQLYVLLDDETKKLEEERDELENKKRFFKDVISKMIHLHQQSPSRPKVRFFEGEAGIKELRKELAEKHLEEDSYEIFDYAAMLTDETDELHREEVNKRPKNVVCVCSNGGDSGLDGKQIKRGNISFNIVRTVGDGGEKLFAGEISVYKDKVIMFSPGQDKYKDVFGIIIEDKKIAQTMRVIVKTLLMRSEK